MTHKEIAARLDDALNQRTSAGLVQSLKRLRNTLDPPKPAPGAVVWWRYKHNHAYGWQLGEVSSVGVDEFGKEGCVPWESIEYRPARILAPDEVAVKVPPLSEWPEATQGVNIWAQYTDGLRGDILATITRAEAEKMER